MKKLLLLLVLVPTVTFAKGELSDNAILNDTVSVLPTESTVEVPVTASPSQSILNPVMFSGGGGDPMRVWQIYGGTGYDFPKVKCDVPEGCIDISKTEYYKLHS